MPPIERKEPQGLFHLGLDPGTSSGSLVLLKDGQPYPSDDWYIKLETATEHDISIWFFNNVKSPLELGRLTAVIEQVNAMPGNGVSGMFKFGMSYGFLRGLLVAYRVPFTEVRPVKWQKALSCLSKGDKNITKAKAQKLWPKYASQITHKNADALLLAEYGRRFC